MKCFEVFETHGVSGLPIVRTDDGPRLKVAPDQALLRLSEEGARFSEGLSKRLQATRDNDTFEFLETRLLQCEFDRRNELFLVPDSGNTDDRALVLFHYSAAWHEPFFFVEHENTQKLLENGFVIDNPKPPQWMIHEKWYQKQVAGKSVLVDLGPGEMLRVVVRIREPKPYNELVFLPRIYHATRGSHPWKESAKHIFITNVAPGQLELRSEAASGKDGPESRVTIYHGKQ